MTLLELGSHHGNSTRVYAECFGKVIGVDATADNVAKAKVCCQDVNNVEFIVADVYSNDFEIPEADVVNIDVGHTYELVCYDIDRVLKKLPNATLIIDDYGHWQGAKKAVDEYFKDNPPFLHVVDETCRLIVKKN